MNRHIVVFCWNTPEHLDEIISTLNCSNDQITVAYKYGTVISDSDKYSKIEIPQHINTEPKARNFINQQFKSENFTGFLHILTDLVHIKKDPVPFMTDIENMMTILDYPVWFNTMCDQCNYLYKKYNPRLSITIDRMEFAKLKLGQKLIYTSHSNTQWVCYDFSKTSDDLLKFDESYTIAMFWIIEYLARRRNTRLQGQIFFMNQYLTIESEYGVFESYDFSDDIDPEQMKKEDMLFKSRNINFTPDNNIDQVLEMTYEKMLSKI